MVSTQNNARNFKMQRKVDQPSIQGAVEESATKNTKVTKDANLAHHFCDKLPHSKIVIAFS